MNTYLKIDGPKETLLYAQITCENGQLHITNTDPLRKSYQEAIPLAAIQRLTKDTFWGGQRITFQYEENFYTFYECGLGVVDYLVESLNL